ncbi:hypothetical protein RRG08_004654 [Elysia crispata]|uniref:E3 UFM1-protein ligase 1 homolog n=1 Tax=Elysia crispata TaxID=231223 RepID=A0AAE0ZER8_9GAST|nr:hypothetical protein RRG08_004654 [Elysia crispata]
MVKRDGHLTLVLGQLISKTYRDHMAEEINDLLQEKGHVTIVGLTQTHDLPADFIREVIDEYLGKKIKGQIDNYDKDVIFTDAFVARMRAQIRGAFSAVTVPTTIGPIRQAIGCKEHLFHTILEDLISSRRLAGSVSGSRQDKSQFLPEIYTRAQSEWIDSFYKQNGYLEYDALTRLGISDPKGYIKKRFKTEQLVYLTSCCVGPGISEQVQYGVDEALNTGTWVDLKTVLPSILSEKDVSELLSSCLKTRPNAIVCGSTIVGSDKLVSESTEAFTGIMTQKAEAASKAQPAHDGKHAGGEKSSHSKVAGLDDGSSAREDKRDQRRKKAATAGSSKKEGTGGREVKMKSTKKKGGRGRDLEDGSDEEGASPSAGSAATNGPGKAKQQDLKFLTVVEIEEVLSKQSHLQDCPPELISEIASKLHRPLTRQYQEVAKSIFLKGSGADRKKTAQEIQDKVNGLWTNAHLFEKGIKLFEDPTQGLLIKHLLKTVCSDLANTVVIALASDNMVNLPTESDEQLSAEARLRFIGTLPRQVQEPLSKLHVSLNGASLEDFFQQTELLCGPSYLGILLKKADKKRERQLVFNHRHSLSEQLKAERDPAMTLHLAVVLLFQTLTQCMLHCPGRLVPTVLTYVAGLMEEEALADLTAMQNLVVQLMKLKADPINTEEEEAEVTTQMNELLDKVKAVALNTKKSAAVSEDH